MPEKVRCYNYFHIFYTNCFARSKVIENPNMFSPSLRLNFAIGDYLSPFFLHHSNSPGLILVSQPLIGDYYASWSHSMMITPSIKNKLGFIDGSIYCSLGDDFLLNAWIRNNNMVILWILNVMYNKISTNIIYFESTRDIWIDLKEHYQ